MIVSPFCKQAVIQKCAHLEALESLLGTAPLNILKCATNLFQCFDSRPGIASMQPS